MRPRCVKALAVSPAGAAAAPPSTSVQFPPESVVAKTLLGVKLPHETDGQPGLTSVRMARSMQPKTPLASGICVNLYPRQRSRRAPARS